ncbi:lipopolysaccharide-binding protein-like [Perognathus longimembris pacificus]|uniref:lipopolysaccharide-binding protein-like n=1 Tax=Perognathus longimembris pacificus TaxID=214514 RepID=UPI002018CD95|nr:lipopolysaccharide-binding protein-like [Perognathus longimembris pacificus]
MKARLHCVVVALLLLMGSSRFGEGTSNPGIVVQITRKGLEYAHQYAIAILKKELSTITVPSLSGRSRIRWIGSVSYDFYSLHIDHLVLQNSELSLLPKQGLRASLSNNYMSMSGNWKVKKAFITLRGTFDLSMDGISISVSLNLGKDQSGRPTVSVTHCSNSIGHVRVRFSGSLSWIINLFHQKIENNIKRNLEQKICEMVRKSAASNLNPYLQSLPVTTTIDQVSGIDYSLVENPQVTANNLNVFFKGEFFSQSHRSPAPFEAPALTLPQQYERMVYFVVSEYVFNTASRVYYQAGLMKVTITNEHLKSLTTLAAKESAKQWRKQNGKPNCGSSGSTPLTTMVLCYSSNFLLPLLQGNILQLNTNTLQALVPQLSKLYRNMQVELEVSPESEPLPMFTPGNVTLTPVMNIQAFALLPNSTERQTLFQLRVKTNVSISISMKSNRIIGSVTEGSKLELELKHSNVSYINMELMDAILNYHTLNTIYPSLNAKLEEGFPLPLPRNTFLKNMELQIHKNFLLLGADIIYAKDYL